MGMNEGFSILGGVAVGLAVIAGIYMLISQPEVEPEERSEAFAMGIYENCDVFPQPLVPQVISLKFSKIRFGGQSQRQVLTKLGTANEKLHLYIHDVTYKMRDIGGDICDVTFNLTHLVESITTNEIKNLDESNERLFTEAVQMNVQGYQKASLSDYLVTLELKASDGSTWTSRRIELSGAGPHKAEITPDMVVSFIVENIRRPEEDQSSTSGFDRRTSLKSRGLQEFMSLSTSN